MRAPGLSPVAPITGCLGLVGRQAARALYADGLPVVGIDSDLRVRFFGLDASTSWALEDFCQSRSFYEHYSIDIPDARESASHYPEWSRRDNLDAIFRELCDGLTRRC